MNELDTPTKNIDIKEVNGKTTIIFRKAALKGRVTSGQVLNTILIAAQMQAEKYIEKLSRGAPLDTNEIKALKELADITKLQLIDRQVDQLQLLPMSEETEKTKQTLYSLLAERLDKK